MEGAVDGGPWGEGEGIVLLELFAIGESVALVGGDEEEVGFVFRGEGKVAVFVSGGVAVWECFDGDGVEGVCAAVDAAVGIGGEPDERVGERGAVGVEELTVDGIGIVEGDCDVVIMAVEREFDGIGWKVVAAMENDLAAFVGLPAFGEQE